MNITAADVGKTVVETYMGGCFGTIIDYNPSHDDPVAVRFSDGRVRCLSNDTTAIRFADAPEQKPPPETWVIEYGDDGWPRCNMGETRPDLAGQTFIYRLEK